MALGDNSSLLTLKSSQMSLPCYYDCQTSAQNQELPSSLLHHTTNCVNLQVSQVKTNRILPEYGPQQENPEAKQVFTEG